MKDRERTIFMVCPAVGEGNPAMMYGQKQIFQNDGLSVDPVLLTISAWPARVFHKQMSASPTISRDYSNHGEGLRKIGKYVLGTPMAVQIILSREAFYTPGGQYDILVATQEHALGAFSKEYLEEKFPHGRFLVVGDVEPKKSAIDIAKKKGLTLAVWTAQAYEKLHDEGMPVVLVAPTLPNGFKNDNIFPTQGEHVLVKASGSGMPKPYVDNLQEAFKKLGLSYTIFLPNEIVTEHGTSLRPTNLEQKIREYYAEIIGHIPALTISCPSEQAQISASQERRFVSLPTRGEHEVINLEWAREHGLIIDTIDPENDKDLSGKIRVIFDATQHERLCAPPIEIGSRTLSSQIDMV